MISEYNILSLSESNVQMIRGVQNRTAVLEESVEKKNKLYHHLWGMRIATFYIRTATSV